MFQRCEDPCDQRKECIALADKKSRTETKSTMAVALEPVGADNTIAGVHCTHEIDNVFDREAHESSGNEARDNEIAAMRRHDGAVNTIEEVHFQWQQDRSKRIDNSHH